MSGLACTLKYCRSVWIIYRILSFDRRQNLVKNAILHFGAILYRPIYVTSVPTKVTSVDRTYGDMNAIISLLLGKSVGNLLDDNGVLILTGAHSSPCCWVPNLMATGLSGVEPSRSRLPPLQDELESIDNAFLIRFSDRTELSLLVLLVLYGRFRLGSSLVGCQTYPSQMTQLLSFIITHQQYIPHTVAGLQ